MFLTTNIGFIHNSIYKQEYDDLTIKMMCNMLTIILIPAHHNDL